MSTTLGLTRAEARANADADKASQREREAACRMDFRVYGDGQAGSVLGHKVQAIPHAERCICAPPCSFTYDHVPNDQAEPLDTRLYEGSAIGALYGAANCEHIDLEARLEGWVLTPRSDRYE